jgi:hypothetical protein
MRMCVRSKKEEGSGDELYLKHCSVLAQIVALRASKPRRVGATHLNTARLGGEIEHAGDRCCASEGRKAIPASMLEKGQQHARAATAGQAVVLQRLCCKMMCGHARVLKGYVPDAPKECMRAAVAANDCWATLELCARGSDGNGVRTPNWRV